MMKDDIDKILVTNEQIQTRIKEIAADIHRDFGDEKIVMICIVYISLPTSREPYQTFSNWNLCRSVLTEPAHLRAAR